MSFISCEEKLRTLAMQNAALAAALTFTIAPATPPQFLWMDRQLAQNAIGTRSDNRTCVTVQRISTVGGFAANQGATVSSMKPIRLQVNVVDYNAERARQVANLITRFMLSVSLLDPGEFGSPVTSPTQAPNYLLNERGGMYFAVQPPAYTEIQDWRVFNNENVP